MTPHKLITIPQAVTPANFEQVMQQAIALELATIPTYLSTYYSIKRSLDQDALYAKLQAQLATSPGVSAAEVDQLAQELKLDVLVYANKTAALIMSVVIEEMLHLALACNVKQAIVAPPDLLSINEALVFPTMLDGHEPEFTINAAKLSLDQLSTFLQIESPRPFKDPVDTLEKAPDIEKYKTIGRLYVAIQHCIREHYHGPYLAKPQLVSAPKAVAQHRPYYSQNSINTVYYDRAHNPTFASSSDSGDLIGVTDAHSAIAAIEEIMHQGEGNVKPGQSELHFGPNHMPIPLRVKNGEVQFKPGDYDDTADKELSHFAKFLEAYSLGVHYQEKFAGIGGLDDFFSYFVCNQASDPKLVDYHESGNVALALCAQLGNAVFTYILLMIEACYYADEDTQFRVFLYGVHKSMIWLLSGVGNGIRGYSYIRGQQTYVGSLTFEYFDFSRANPVSPKQQILDLVEQLAKADPTNWGWTTQPEYSAYWPSLPDVRLNHRVVPNVPAVPA
ncbi:MAG: ferritin-like domain-containing protein [Janthinobacterium lividum]